MYCTCHKSYLKVIILGVKKQWIDFFFAVSPSFFTRIHAHVYYAWYNNLSHVLYVLVYAASLFVLNGPIWNAVVLHHLITFVESKIYQRRDYIVCIYIVSKLHINISRHSFSAALVLWAAKQIMIFMCLALTSALIEL